MAPYDGHGRQLEHDSWSTTVVTEDELRLRHLADVQAVIDRLSQHSFIVRGWSVTLVSVVFAIIVTSSHEPRPLVLAALAPTWIFWGLDAYYLRQERLYRRLYSAAASRLAHGDQVPGLEPFDMEARRYSAQVSGFARTLLAAHVLAIPMALTILILMVATL